MKYASSTTRRLCLAIALALVAQSGLADEQDSLNCPVDRITLPAEWVEKSDGGAASYRSPGGTEALTTATYRLRAPFTDGKGRAELLQKSAEVFRQAERSLSKNRVVLSAVTWTRSGSNSQLRYSGRDPATDRRLVSLTLISRQCMQNFYYEAIGLSRHEFGKRAVDILDALEIGEASSLPLSAGTRIHALPDAGVAGLMSVPNILKLGGIALGR
ncbi:MAG: hypothetical protein ACRETN_09265 [Nevskiales bacterium]